MSHNLTDAAEIELETFVKDGALGTRDATDDMSVSRWTKKGDRLYINGGIPKSEKYKLYVDLETHEVHSNNEHKHTGGSVKVDGDTAVINVEESCKRTHEITVGVEWD